MSVSQAYFDKLYCANADPWQVRDLWYERRKRAIVLAMLSRPRYGCVFEPGCGTGELTLCLADRCESVIAYDYSATAIALAGTRLVARHNVVLMQKALPVEWPSDSDGKFDLIIVSELAYYLDNYTLSSFIDCCAESLQPGGELLACHWRRPFHDRVQETETVHAQLHAMPLLEHLRHYAEPDFMLDTWHKKTASPHKDNRS